MASCYKFDLLEQDIGFDKDLKEVELVSDTDNIVQSIALTLKTFYGENDFYLNYGTMLQSILGEPFRDEFTIMSIFKEALSHDSRIKDMSVDWVDYEPTSHVLTAKIHVTLYNDTIIDMIVDV